MRSAERPRVGVTGPDRGGFPAWIFTRFALRRAGAQALRIRPSSPVAKEELDGLVLGGGADVSQGLGEAFEDDDLPPPQQLPWVRRALDRLLGPVVVLVRLLGATRPHGPDRRRDRLELALLAHARSAGLPVLGICRGAQLMNVAEQGTLQRDLHALYEERAHLYTVLPRRMIRVDPASRLYAVLQREELSVNSLHFHAIAEPGRDIRVVAREASGVVQAIEHTQRPFWIGVQWHPEYLPQRELQQRLFRALVEGAQAFREARRFSQSDGHPHGALLLRS